MRSPLTSRPSARKSFARIAVAMAFVLPAVAASAIAAPLSVDESPSSATRPGSVQQAKETNPTKGTASTNLAAVVAGWVVGANVEAEGPYNPVQAKVDYGTAINGFGNERGRPHEGQDMFAPEGTPVISPSATEVLETGTDSERGNWAALYEPESKRTFVYMHMLKPAGVKAGDQLEPGDRVGLLGCTGSCDGAHLHFEIREGRDPYGTAIDPLPDMQRWQEHFAG